MQKAPDAFRTISEVAKELDLPQHVLRFWETRFSQIKPMKRGGGRRYYRPDDISLLRGIRHLLYGEGYTIKGVQRILKEQGVRFITEGVDAAGNEKPAPAAPVAPVSPAEPVIASTQEAVVEPSVEVKVPQPIEDTPTQQPSVTQGQQAAVNVGGNSAPQQSAQSASIPNNPNAEIRVDSEAAPFTVTHNVPNHLVDAITTQQSVLESAAEPSQEAEASEEWPYDVLPDTSDAPEDEAIDKKGKSRARGLLKRVKFTSAQDLEKEGSEQSILSDSHMNRLQETLVDLLECKRLLDQIR